MQQRKYSELCTSLIPVELELNECRGMIPDLMPAYRLRIEMRVGNELKAEKLDGSLALFKHEMAATCTKRRKTVLTDVFQGQPFTSSFLLCVVSNNEMRCSREAIDSTVSRAYHPKGYLNTLSAALHSMPQMLWTARSVAANKWRVIRRRD